MAILVSTGPGKVLDWGFVTLWGPELDLTISEEDFVLTVRFVFHSDGGSLAVATEFSEDALLLHCHNFDGADGRGSARPVLLGEADEDLFFLHFRIFRFGETEDRTVHYTVYRVAKTAVGWTPKSG